MISFEGEKNMSIFLGHILNSIAIFAIKLNKKYYILQWILPFFSKSPTGYMW